MNVRTISATILYIAFEHIDHWPVPLVKAYAEDCFGPRHWVDEPACQLLVKNLALSHLGTNDDAESENNIQTEADAFMVAEFYRVEEEKTESHSPSPTKHKKRGSMSSLASHSSSLSVPSLTSNRPRSSSCGSSEAPEPKVLPTNRPRSSSSGSFEAPEPKVIPTAPSITKDGEESDSGDEEEVAVATSVPKQSSADNGDSSSSGEEDEEVVETSKSFDDESVQNLSSGSEKNYTHPPPSLNPTYPVVQHNFNFKRIRQRYFGLNLGCAHLAISSSLNDRLDVKSKQNSGLLQSLPAFTSIPSVRTLITANLEKWLQSPALAGLGRSLFSRTVNMMKNVDPPLPADLEAIDNILSMRLKANQVNRVLC